MKYYEAPNPIPDLYDRDRIKSIFLAGSITGAVNWQKEMVNIIFPYYHIFNPRRSNFDVTDSNMEKEQITWEFNALRYCPTVLFYFSSETLAPITLFEYGKMLLSHKNLFVCVHPDYKRKNDVLIQTALVDQKLADRICFDLYTLADQVIDFSKTL